MRKVPFIDSTGIHNLTNLCEMSKKENIQICLLYTSTDPTLKDAVAFTEMVIKYVADGSGTHDMIETAISRLKSAAGL